MSSDGTPGYPAPDTACIVVTFTRRMPNCAQRRERHREDDRRAIGIGDDHALPALGLSLLLEQAQVRGVDFGNEQRHERVHAVAARVAQHDVAGRGELVLELVGGLGIERREDDLRPRPGHAAVHGHRRGPPSGMGVARRHGAASA